MTTQTIGVGSRDISSRLSAIELGLAALLGADAGIGARRVDQADDRQAELRGQLHLVERLAVALGMGAAEEALVALLERAALLVADEHHLEVVEPGEAGADGPVVAERPVAVQLDELVEDQLDVVERLRPLADAGRPGPSPRR